AYDDHLIQGQISFVTGLNADKLESWTEQVLENNRAGDDDNGESLREFKNKIKHVIYIAKENRTYDQVLGDVPGGNGDSSLTLFGKNVTPNQHALAQRFVLLDNFFVNGEVSFDGWSWLSQAQGNENLIKAAPYNYSGRGRNYDSEGQNN